MENQEIRDIVRDIVELVEDNYPEVIDIILDQKPPEDREA